MAANPTQMFADAMFSRFNPGFICGHLRPSAYPRSLPVSLASVSRENSLHHRPRLLAQVLWQVVERSDRLARRAAAFPAAEGLVSRPCAGGGALRTIRVRD